MALTDRDLGRLSGQAWRGDDGKVWTGHQLAYRLTDLRLHGVIDRMCHTHIGSALCTGVSGYERLS